MTTAPYTVHSSMMSRAAATSASPLQGTGVGEVLGVLRETYEGATV
ncbi:hypothetical protein [Streptomyces sp. NPDC054834]